MTERGLIDTSVAIVLEGVEPSLLPAELAISALSLAELGAGPFTARSEADRARRISRLQRVESQLESLDFDSSCARSYGHIYAATLGVGRNMARGSRSVGLMIAATALAHALPLYTRNAADLRDLDDLIEIVDVA